MSLLVWLEESLLGIWIRESEWGYPIVLICHTVGMAMVVGGILAFDLRVLCARSATRSTWFDAIFRIAWIGLLINSVSGVVLFSGAAQRFIANPAFQAKLALLAAGGISVGLLTRRMETLAERDPAQPVADTGARLLSGASILFWFGAIGAGRLMAYIR